jgi:hypothetical protein
MKSWFQREPAKKTVWVWVGDIEGAYTDPNGTRIWEFMYSLYVDQEDQFNRKYEVNGAWPGYPDNNCLNSPKTHPRYSVYIRPFLDGYPSLESLHIMSGGFHKVNPKIINQEFLDSLRRQQTKVSNTPSTTKEKNDKIINIKDYKPNHKTEPKNKL